MVTCRVSVPQTSVYLASFAIILSLAIDQQVCYVIGQDGDDLYGIACNNRAYMRKQGTLGAWYGIEKQVWEDAKTKNKNIRDNLVTIEENYSHTGDPEAIKTKGTTTIWGGKCLAFCSL